MITQTERLRASVGDINRGLAVISSRGTVMLAHALATAFNEHIAHNMPFDGDQYRFSYLRQAAEMDVMDEIGKGLFGLIAPSMGLVLRTDQGDIVENAGFILYPANAEGTGQHADTSYGDQLIRLTLGCSGIANMWSQNLGSWQGLPGNVLVQDLTRSVLHSADTLGQTEPRIAAFWDLPASRF